MLRQNQMVGVRCGWGVGAGDRKGGVEEAGAQRRVSLPLRAPQRGRPAARSLVPPTQSELFMSSLFSYGLSMPGTLASFCRSASAWGQ